MSGDISSDILRFITKVLDDVYDRIDNLVKSIDMLREALDKIEKKVEKGYMEILNKLENLITNNRELRATVTEKLTKLANETVEDFEKTLSKITKENLRSVIRKINEAAKLTNNLSWAMQISTLIEEVVKMISTLETYSTQTSTNT